MNLAESMKFVLKKKSQKVFSGLMKEDLKEIVKEAAGDLIRTTARKKKPSRIFTLKESFQDAKLSLQGSALLLKEIPFRINNGFKIFSAGLIAQLDKLPDQKQKTKFCMKVLAGLSKLALSSVYSVGMGQGRLLSFGKSKNIYSQIVMSKLVYKTIQALIIRFIQEIEDQITDPQELKNLQSFREIVLDDSGNAVDKFFEGVTDPNDPAFKLVEDFKNYIFTGELS